MNVKDEIRYYCFNKNCNSSIFFNSTCIIVEVNVLRAFDEVIYCHECFQELVSRPILDLKLQLNKLISEERPIKSIIIDDDPMYHRIFRELIKYSNFFQDISHYQNASTALNYLLKNKGDADNIPDLILLDVNMPKMDAWGFLDKFEDLYPSLSKKSDVYLISGSILPNYIEKIKAYDNVKGMMIKPFDKESLKNFIIK